MDLHTGMGAVMRSGNTGEQQLRCAEIPALYWYKPVGKCAGAVPDMQ